MLFNSRSFFFFFPIVTSLYFLLPHKNRWLLLLLASCVFYMWFIPKYILILGITILIDYTAGILIERSKDPRQKKLYLTVSIISTCLVLFVFKYANFFTANLAELAQALHWNYPIKVLSIILPIGLSFHTFQSLSYVIEVYRGNQKAEHDFGIYALYVMFYPQLVAGPIERPQNLLHQFYETHTFEYRRVTMGLKLMAWGLFKKIVIADRLAVFVNQVYDHPTQNTGAALALATVFFAFQIYCDFSGYSDIAIGAAQVMGFKLMDNFHRPYFAKSISEFWQRWHISLSTWFRDYLYIPLGGNRCSKTRWRFNLFVTFLVSGLWHGANWTYVVWGAINGFYLICSGITAGIRDRLYKMHGVDRHLLLLDLLRIVATFTLVCFAWIFFRARTLRDAYYIVGRIFSGIDLHGIKVATENAQLGFSLILIALLIVAQILATRRPVRFILAEQPAWVRWSFYYAVIFSLLYLGPHEGAAQKFIYFQF